MKKLIFIFFLSLAVSHINAQVGIGKNLDGTLEPDDSAMLDIRSENKGLLVSQIALTGTLDTSIITSPEKSLLIFNTATVSDVYPGYYFWNGNKWERFITGFQQSVKCSNSNTSTNVNTSSHSDAPIFGNTEWNDDTLIYTVGSNYIQVGIPGTYQINVNIIYNIAKSGYSITSQLAINGSLQGPISSTGYVDGKSSDNENGSTTLVELVELVAGDQIQIKLKKDSSKSNSTYLTSIGTSNITVTKIK